ncbi:MAG: chemotaxis response regulator protein-glutamate methylesterase [Fimbriimonadaceae bacterium]|nr:chemotaxis response regulator protein-glutamate methylesterase [Fimbriimonadaceae bacterium]
MKRKVLIVDDSAFVRRMLQDWLKEEPDFEVVGVAKDGLEGVAKAAELDPDVVTLDVEMPNMDGITALDKIMGQKQRAVLMVSSVTTAGAAATLKALELGAYDFVTKPQGGNSLRLVEAKNDFLERLRASRYARFGGGRPASPPPPVRASSKPSDKVVLVASSTGGPRSLVSLFQSLPKGFPCPVVIVQHMPQGFTASLSARLDSLGTVPCREARDGDRLESGQAYIAPGGFHLSIGHGARLTVGDGPTVHGVKPAADILFKSASEAFGSRCLGVVMTGMGRDGADGAVAIRAKGGKVFGEAESSCVIYGMPQAAKKAGGIDAEFDLRELGAAIVAGTTGRTALAS